MAEGARLESVYTATYPGFESPPHRHIRERARTKVRAFFSHVAQPGGVRSPDRGSTTGAASWTDRERSERAARRASAASQSPPHRHILRRARTKVRAFFSYVVQVPSAPLTPALSQGAREKTSAERNSRHIRSPRPLPKGAREKTSAERNSQHIRSPRPSPKGRGRKPAPNLTASAFVPPGLSL